MSNLYNLLKTIIEKLNATKDTVNNLPQPDWNQNDSAAPDYVKNRPFYTDDPVETVLLDNLSIDFTSPESEIILTTAFEEGNTYKVTWNGTVYECVAYTFEPAPGEVFYVIGNMNIANMSGGNNEPFLIASPKNALIGIVMAESPGIYTVSISANIAIIHPIDTKYLPKGGFGYTYLSDEQELFNGTVEVPIDYAETNIQNNFEVVLGEIYTCIFDDVTYTCIGQYGPYGPYIGSKSLMYGDEYVSTEVPFAYYSGNIIVAESGTHTLVINGKINIHNKIEEKYLPSAPDPLPTVTSDDAGKFLRVSDAGEWVAENIPSASGASF